MVIPLGFNNVYVTILSYGKNFSITSFINDLNKNGSVRKGN